VGRGDKATQDDDSSVLSLKGRKIMKKMKYCMGWQPFARGMSALHIDGFRQKAVR
jgi:hypothetical protein